MNNHQLPGRGALPSPRMPTGLIGIAMLFVVSVLGYAGWKIASTHHFSTARLASATVTGVNATVPAYDNRMDELAHHLYRTETLIVAIEEKEKKIQLRLSQVSPVLQQNYLVLEHRRVDNADQLSEFVLRDAGEALDELELAKQDLAQRRK